MYYVAEGAQRSNVTPSSAMSYYLLAIKLCQNIVLLLLVLSACMLYMVIYENFLPSHSQMRCLLLYYSRHEIGVSQIWDF